MDPKIEKVEVTWYFNFQHEIEKKEEIVEYRNRH